MSTSILVEKSYAFALRVVRLSKYLNDERREFILSRKVLDSGTSIAKTIYWLRLLRASEHISNDQASPVLSDCEELQKMLIASRKTTRNAG